MFGIGDIFSKGLLGGFFDKIGLGFMNDVLSLATNVMTGNWLAAAKDVFDLVSQFGNSWQNKTSQFQPLPREFSNGLGFGTEGFSQYRADDLSGRARSYDPSGSRASTRTLQLWQETTFNYATANSNLLYAQANQRV